MSVSPIGNLQAMLPNSSEVGNIQNKMNHQVTVAQNFGNEKLQQDSDMKQTQVYAKDSVEEEKIRDDEQNSNNGGAYSQNRKKKNTSKEEKTDLINDAIRGHNIDIKL